MRKKVKKQAIFSAAVQAFARKGFHGTTLDEIADCAGIAKGTIYLYVSSKEELLKLVLKEGLALYMQQLQQRWQHCQSPREKIERFIDHQVDTARTYGNAYRVLLEEEAGLEKKIQHKTRRARQHLLRELKEAFGDLRKENDLKIEERLLACLLLCASSMTSIKMLRDNHISFQEMKRNLKMLFLP